MKKCKVSLSIKNLYICIIKEQAKIVAEEKISGYRIITLSNPIRGFAKNVIINEEN